MASYHEVPKIRVENEFTPESKVVLHFFRHEAKGKAAEGQPDQEVELKPEGRAAAIARGKEKVAHPEVSWAAGSERIRSAHTALLRMASGNANLTPEMTFAEAVAEIQMELKAAGGSKAKEEKKVGVRPELNFVWDGTPEFKKAAYDSDDQGRSLSFLLNESDMLVYKVKDMKSLSYSRTAANYASLIAKYMAVGNRFNEIVTHDKDEKYKKYGDQLERFFGTHQPVGEMFYMKALEKTSGHEKAEEFIRSFGNEPKAGNGFGFQEGFDVRITNGPEGQKVVLQGIRGFTDIELTPDILVSIIADAEQLDAQIESETNKSE